MEFYEEKMMSAQCIGSGKNSIIRRFLAVIALFSLLLTACSSSTAALTPSSPMPAGSPPEILRVSDRQEVVNGYLYYYQDIYFTDADVDAVAVTYSVISSSLDYPLNFPDAPLGVPASDQAGEALFVETTACWQRMELVYESRIRDQAGNLSAPVRMSMSCAAPQPFDAQPLLVSALGTAVPIALVLALGFWLLFRKRPAERLPAVRSALLLLFLFMLLKFLQFLFHEGGHALYLLACGAPVTLYIHPFLFSGFARPILPAAGVWSDVLGSAVALPVSLLISLPFWKRRSVALLPVVMLFPFTAMLDGFNIMGITGDFWNVVQSTGLPAVLFMFLGVVIICIGVIALFSLLPLTGLDPNDSKAFFVLPASLFLMSTLSFLAAYLFVPGSPIDLEYFAGREILAGADSFLLTLVLGVILAGLYTTLFRKLYPRLPAWLHSGTAALAWKDLLLPGLLWLVSLVIGLIIII